MEPNNETPGKQQAVNLRALRWAYEQDDLGVTMKAVLMTFAMHANERGYSWPSVGRIASTWQLHRATVRRQIDALLVRRMICRTKKRCGATGQVKVFRMPRAAREVVHSAPLPQSAKRTQSGVQVAYKWRTSDPEHDNDKQKNISPYSPTVGNSTPTTSAKRIPESDFVFEGHQNQNQPAQDNIKFPEFAAWCRSKGGTPTEAGFCKWLRQQKPQWRNKVRQKFGGEEGYELDGQFFTREQANQRGIKNPELLEKFRKARKCDGKIEIIPP